ncbi:hypothetical protein RIF29_09156 [Crotalaria pallida]|uniref:Uncharacterized protein n=1 Tax=Crotalaria pallida TaxID=3830 RepID=A0AAN9IKI2_CROPI
MLACADPVVHLLYLMRVSKKAFQRIIALTLARLCSANDQNKIFINNYVDDTSEGAVVQRKGRFKVTSADPMGPSNCTFGPVVGVPSSPLKQNFIGASILPSLQCILQ